MQINYSAIIARLKAMEKNIEIFKDEVKSCKIKTV